MVLEYWGKDVIKMNIVGDETGHNAMDSELYILEVDDRSGMCQLIMNKHDYGNDIDNMRSGL